MLKTSSLNLPGRDESGGPLIITELPALTADRHARAVLDALGVPNHGGVVSLALEHLPALLRAPDRAVGLLEPFVQASRPVRGWQNVLAVQQAALALHVGFLVGRPALEIPVAMRGDSIRRQGGAGGEAAVNFCSPHIATVLHSGHATYRELETVLSTEDVFNIVELVNVEAIRDWRATQTSGRPA